MNFSKSLWLGVLSSVAFTACPKGGVAQDLSMTAKPAAILDTGETTTLTASAGDTQGNAGQGSVHFQAPVGSLRNGLDVTLDADGLAKAEFSCKLADDAECKGEVVITASWTSGGVTVTAERKVLIMVEPLRGACEPGFERPISILKSDAADIQLVVAPEVSEHSPLVAGGNEVGFAYYDPTNRFGGFALSIPPDNYGLDIEAAARGAIGTLGTVDNPLIQTFRSWDKYENSVRATYELDSMADLKAAINQLASAVSGGATLNGGLTGTAGATGPFKLIVTYVRRVARTVVVLAITPVSTYTEAQAGLMDNVAGGTSLGQVDDTLSPADMIPCEFKMSVAKEKIDFLWVVDDSCSMASSQAAVYTAGTIFSSRLASAGLDWRVSASTTGYYPSSFDGSFRQWINTPKDMLTWFQSGNPNWFGTSGDGTETGLQGLTSFLAQLQAPMASVKPGPVRPDAQLQVIILSDAPDQSVDTAVSTVNTAKMLLQPGQRMVTHGIRCPALQNCGDSDVGPDDKYQTIAQLTGGVVGDIRVFNVEKPTPAQRARQGETMAAIMRSAIAGAGQELLGFPIGSTVKVAASSTFSKCRRNDIPRSVEDGWDLDPSTGKIIFYGACAPNADATIAISYRSFADTTPETVTPPPPVDAGSGGGAGGGSGSDAGASLSVVANRAYLFRDIADQVNVSAQLSGVTPNLGQPLEFTTTAGAFLVGDAGVTSLTVTTGPSGVVGVKLIETGASGEATITARHVARGLTGSTTVDIRQLQQISHVRTTCGTTSNCTLMGVRGSGYNEVAQVVFKLTDGLDRPAPGVPVQFSGTLPMGTTLTPNGVTNAMGEVTASVQAGSALGTFAIQAVVIPGQVEGVSPTLAIRGAKPANKQFRLTCATINIPAYISPNPPLSQTVSCTVRIVDRNNNPVGTGAPVSLKTEAGVVPNNVLTAAYSNNNPDEGLGTFSFSTVGGIWPAVDVAPLGADTGQYPYARTAEPSRPDGALTRNPRDGLVTILAYVVGEEHFDDDNGNGVYDLGESFVDQGEPFVDANDNNVWDPGEIIVPELVGGVDNGVWDPPNGVYDRTKVIWTEARILMTNYAEPGLGSMEGTLPAMCPGGIAKGGYADFRAYAPDLNFNRVMAGAALTTVRSGTRGSVGWATSTTLLDDYGFDYERKLLDAVTGQACTATSTRCEWKTLFGNWDRGYVGTVRVTGAMVTDTTPCADEPGLATQVSVLGVAVQTPSVSVFGIQ